MGFIQLPQLDHWFRRATWTSSGLGTPANRSDQSFHYSVLSRFTTLNSREFYTFFFSPCFESLRDKFWSVIIAHVTGLSAYFTDFVYYPHLIFFSRRFSDSSSLICLLSSFLSIPNRSSICKMWPANRSSLIASTVLLPLKWQSMIAWLWLYH